MLPSSDRKIPPWVIASVVLLRLKSLLDALQRKFDLVSVERHAPRGQIDWKLYATRQLSRARFLSVPCRFPELCDDHSLKSAIKFALQILLQSLASQRNQGTFALTLIDLCQQLLARLRDVEPQPPSFQVMSLWLSRSLNAAVLRDGLAALAWTIEQRGLAGPSDLAGLPWTLSLDQFFEAWVETIMVGVVIHCGGRLKTGRRRETLVPLTWSPPYLSSQRSLLPDLVIERDDLSVIIDAKYKDHWEKLQSSSWINLAEEIRQRHREDLLQILAYSTVARSPSALICLAYPCQDDTWNSLLSRGRLFYRASIPVTSRRINLLLTAFPMSVKLMNQSVQLFAEQIKSFAAGY